MAQISSINSAPDPISNLTPVTLKSGNAQKAASNTVLTDDAQTSSPLQAQLTRLSAVLNGLQTNAVITRVQYVQAYNQVKSGTYNVNALEVSRSIVQDMLTKQ